MSIASRHIRNPGKLYSSSDGPQWLTRYNDDFVDHRFALDFALRASEQPASAEPASSGLASAPVLQALAAPSIAPDAILPDPASRPGPTIMVPSTVTTGQAAVIGYNTGQTDGNGTTVDSLEFVILTPIGSGTIIRFTDRAWVPTPGNNNLNAGSFTNAAGDGSFAFTAGADLAAGTVISATFTGGNVVFTVNGVASAPISAGGFDPNEAGDAIYVYQGSDANTPTAFLSATEIGDGNTTFNGSLVNTGLVNGVTAVSTALDSATYHGPTTEAFAHFYNNERLLENIMDSTNWVGDDADGQKALDQPNHNGPYNLSPNLGLWIAGQGGGQALVHVGGDPSVSSGQFGYNLTQLYTNYSNLVGGARDVVFDTVEGKFFVAEGERILQGNISDLLGNPSSNVALTVLYTGTKPDGMVTQFGDNNIFNLELDTVNNIIYFSHGSQLSKIVYNTAGQTATVLADFNVGNPVAGSNRNHIDDFVIHFASGTVYATSHRITSGQDGDQLTKNYIYRITGLDAADGTNAFTFANGLVTFLPFAPDDDDATNGFTWAPGEAFPQEEGTLEGVAISSDGNTLYFSAASTLYDHDGDGGIGGGMGTAPQLRMGGVFSYALTGNPTGTYSQIWQQLDDGDTVSQAISHTFGPQGLLDDIEYDPVTGHLYFLDQTGDQLGAVNPPGDEGIWRIATNGTGLTYFANINNINAMGPSSIWLNHAPTVTSSTQATPTVTEPGGNPGTNSGATALVQPFTALDVTDHETASHASQQLAGATIWISNNFQSGVTHQDTLTINGTQSGTVNGITFSYNAATGAMILTGADTFADYETAIALVRFNTSGDNPTNYGAATNRTISWAVSDGLGHSDPVSTTIDVFGVNDAPVNTPGAAMNFTEDTVGSLGAEGVPPTPVSNAVTGISVFDVDANPATQDITVTLSVGVGTLNIRTNVVGGIVAGDITGGANGSGTITITATQNEINTTLAAMSPAFTGPPAVAAAPNGLIYTPPANYNGAANLTITTNDNGFNGNDPGNSGTGTTEADIDVKVLNLANVNDAPTVTDATQAAATILEDIPSAAGETVTSLFNASFSDALDQQQTGGNPTGSVANTLAGIAVVANGSSGATGQWQYFNGVSWVDIGAASLASAQLINAGTAIRFTPALNFNGAAPTLTVHLVDSSGGPFLNGDDVNLSGVNATGLTTRYSTGTVVLSQDVTPVNDAPTQTNLSGDTATYTEQQALAALLDVGSNATVADVDSPNFDGGTLTVAITAGLVAAEDQLVIRTVGTVTFTANTVSVGGTQIATYVGGGAGGGNLVFTLNPDATPATVTELIRAIAYNNSAGDAPTDGNRTITWTLVDGDGTLNGGVDTLNVTSTLNVDPINDAPQGTDMTVALYEDNLFSFTNGVSHGDYWFGFSDIDGNNFAGVEIVTLATAGTLFYAADGITEVAVTAGQFVTAQDIADGKLRYRPVADGNGTPYATFTFKVRDDGATGGANVNQDPNADTYTFNVYPINDAPLHTAPAAASLNEGGTLVFSTANANVISVADVDAGGADLTTTVSIADGALSVGAVMAGLAVTGEGTNSLTLVGTLAEINDALQGLSYTPPANANGPRTLTVTTNDGGATGDDPGNTGGANDEQDSDQIAITINSVNDEPAGADKTVVASEDDPYVFLTGDFGFTDPIDLDDFAGVVLTTLPLEGDLRLNGVNITVAGTFITAADIASGLLTFLADPDESGDAYASFTFQVRDDGGILNGGVDTDQSANTITIDVEPDNLEPVIADLSGDLATFTEGDSAAVLLDDSTAPELAATVSDGDNAHFNGGSLTASIITGEVAAQDVLGLSTGAVTLSDGTNVNSVVSVNGTAIGTVTANGTGGDDLVITFNSTEATPARVSLLIQALTYFNSGGEDPAAGDRIIAVSVDDGLGGTDTDTVTVTVVAINDAPTLTATGADPTFTEGGAAADLFGTVTADTVEAAQTFASLTLTVSNVADGASEILSIDGSNLALTDGNSVVGTATNGLTVTVSVTAGTATVTFSGASLSEAALQTLVDGLAYSNASQNPTAGTRVVTITEVVDSGSPTAPNDNSTDLSIESTVIVQPVNDAPVVTTSAGTTSFTEGTPVVIDPSLTLDDVDNPTLFNAVVSVSGSGVGVGEVLSFVNDNAALYGNIAIVASGPTSINLESAGSTATLQQWQNALRAVTYSNSSEDPTPDDRIVSFSVTDGTDVSNFATKTVTVTPLNDAPLGADATIVMSEDGSRALAQADFGFSDPAEGDDFAGVAITTLPTNGELRLNGVAITVAGTFVTEADITAGLLVFHPDAHENGSPYASFTFQVRDDGGTAGGGQDTDQSANTLTFNVGAINDGPVNSVPAATQVFNEDGTLVFSTVNGNAISVADLDADPGDVTVTLAIADGALTLATTAGLTSVTGDGTSNVVLTGSVAEVNAALDGLSYAPPAHANGARNLSVSTSDNGNSGTGGAIIDTDMVAITVTSVNDAPSSTGGSVTGSEDDPYVFTAADFNFSDPVEGHGFFAVQITTLPAAGDILLNGAPVLAGDFIAVSAINAGMLTFQPDPDGFGAPYTTFTFRVQDGGGVLNGGVDTDPTPRTMTINVTPDNLAPEVDLNGAGAGLNAAVSYTEDAPGVSIGSSIAVSDPNEVTGDLIESATITLTDAVAGDALTVTLPLPGGITAVTTTPAGQIVVTLSGPASTADYAAAIAQLLYSTTSQDPTFGGTDPTRTITVTVEDGMLTSAVATSTVTITPLDDAAVAQPDAFATDEDTMVSGNVFLANPTTPDGDVDGPALEVGAVNGSAGDVGDTILLPSGAELTLNSDGSFVYHPLDAFETLPGPLSGASNLTDTDSFTYTLVNGNEVTVTITISGLDSDGDILLGTPGADTLDGGIGADQMTGFAGNDSYAVDNAGDTVVEVAGEGNDTIRTAVSYTLAAGLSVETLTTTNQAGLGAIDLAGNEIDNRIEGNDGVNLIAGHGGEDLLYGNGGGDGLTGGAGNDLLDGGAGIDTAFFAGSPGFTDTLVGWVASSFEGSDILRNVEISVEGSGQRNLLVGSTGFATIQAASDSAVTGDNIRLAAGSYSGTVTYDVGGLTVIGQTGSQQNVTYAPVGTFGISVFGANLVDTITTGAGDDSLNGGGGDDVMTGGQGHDTYHVLQAGDVVIEAPGGGVDIIFTAVSYALNDGSEVEVLATRAFDGTDPINLTGNGLANYMIGNDGANTLDGKAGADVMVGRAGHDTYIVYDAGDQAVENAGGGVDILFTAVSYALNDFWEVEVLATIAFDGTAPIDLTGNALANYMIGNDGANTMDGKGGSDVLVGRAGEDRFAFTTALGAGNVDTIFEFVAADDTIALDSELFGLADGPLDPNAFRVGTAAADADDRIIYDDTTGYLYFDADGSGTDHSAILFAILQNAPALTASEFTMI